MMPHNLFAGNIMAARLYLDLLAGCLLMNFYKMVILRSKNTHY